MADNAFNELQAKNALSLIRQGYAPSQFCGRDAVIAMPVTELPVFGAPLVRTLPEDPSVIELWALDNDAFSNDYTTAKRAGADAMVAYCLTIADCDDTKADQKKVRIDTRMKLAAIWNPEKYGPKADKDTLGGIQAMVHVPYHELSADKKTAVDKFFGTDDD